MTTLPKINAIDRAGEQPAAPVMVQAHRMRPPAGIFEATRNGGVRIQRVGPEIIRPLRAAILRPGRPAVESVYPLDEHSDTAHFGAFIADGAIIGSASVFHQAAPIDDPHVPSIAGERDAWRSPLAWRLRGMTVIESQRGTGCGAALLDAAIEHATRSGGRCLWFHARASARGFYEHFGFSAIGPVYDSPHIGEHLFMWRAIEGVQA